MRNSNWHERAATHVAVLPLAISGAITALAASLLFTKARIRIVEIPARTARPIATVVVAYLVLAIIVRVVGNILERRNGENSRLGKFSRRASGPVITRMVDFAISAIVAASCLANGQVAGAQTPIAPSGETSVQAVSQIPPQEASDVSAWLFGTDTSRFESQSPAPTDPSGWPVPAAENLPVDTEGQMAPAHDRPSSRDESENSGQNTHPPNAGEPYDAPADSLTDELDDERRDKLTEEPFASVAPSDSYETTWAPPDAALPPSTPPEGDRSEHSTAPSRNRAHYTVRSGDSLWSISSAHLGSDATIADIDRQWREIYELNEEEIGANPSLIHPGAVLLVPAELEGAAK